MVYIGRTLNELAGKVYPVSWDAALVLRDLGVEFLLLVSDGGDLCQRFERLLLRFIKRHRLLLYVVTVSITEDSEAAAHLGAVYVPQLRFYRNGNEIGRHRGLATYEVLENLIGLPC